MAAGSDTTQNRSGYESYSVECPTVSDIPVERMKCLLLDHNHIIALCKRKFYVVDLISKKLTHYRCDAIADDDIRTEYFSYITQDGQLCLSAFPCKEFPKCPNRRAVREYYEKYGRGPSYDYDWRQYALAVDHRAKSIRTVQLRIHHSQNHATDFAGHHVKMPANNVFNYSCILRAFHRFFLTVYPEAIEQHSTTAEVNVSFLLKAVDKFLQENDTIQNYGILRRAYGPPLPYKDHLYFRLADGRNRIQPLLFAAIRLAVEVTEMEQEPRICKMADPFQLTELIRDSPFNRTSAFAYGNGFLCCYKYSGAYCILNLAKMAYERLISVTKPIDPERQFMQRNGLNLTSVTIDDRIITCEPSLDSQKLFKVEIISLNFTEISLRLFDLAAAVVKRSVYPQFVYDVQLRRSLGLLENGNTQQKSEHQSSAVNSRLRKRKIARIADRIKSGLKIR